MSLHEREIRERHAQAAGLRAALGQTRAVMAERAQGQMDLWADWLFRPEFTPSARNLADYLSLAPGDLAPFEQPFAAFGISSLNRSEPHLRASLDAVLATLALISGEGVPDYPPVEVFAAGPARLAARRKAMFGARRNGPKARIMAQLGICSAVQPENGQPPRSAQSHIRQLLQAGASAFRIALDAGTPEECRGLAAVVREVARETGQEIPIQFDLPSPRGSVARMIGGHGRLRVGDRFEIVGKLVKADFPRITLSLPAQWEALREGMTVRINEGKLQGEVIRMAKGVARVEVTSTPARGARLKPGMSVSLPEADLELPPLGAQDLKALELGLMAGDTISVSVQTIGDLEAVFAAGEALGKAGAIPAIVLRIDTARALRNLPDLIVAAGGRTAVGVMVSRPELALEMGYARLTELQDTVFRLCRAAEVPVLWAPNLLERLVQEGRPSRAEMNEAALSYPADCVCLGQGPHLAAAVGELRDLLLRAERYLAKDSASLGGWMG